MRLLRPRSRAAAVATITAGLLTATVAAADPQKLAGIGDSISQGFSANGWPGDHPTYAFGQGTDVSVNSLYARFKAKFPAFTKQFVSVSGAEMVGGSNNAAAQASRICAQAARPDRVVLELGGNDVCNRGTGSATDAASKLYSVTTYRNALKSALDILGGCLPSGAEVVVLSMPRVDYLFEAGNARNALVCNGVWSLAGVCRIVTGEADATRRRQLGTRVDGYNDGIHAEVEAANTRYAGKVHFANDWQGSLATNPNTSVGSYKFGANDINTVDCFHPYKDTGQKKMACAAWETSEFGNLSNISTTCLR